jgi:hypothetical protein
MLAKRTHTEGISFGLWRTKQEFDAIKLIKAHKGLTYKLEGQRYHTQALHQAKKRIDLFHQGKEMPNTKFLEAFQNIMSVIEEYGGEIRYDPGAIKTTLEGKGIDPEDTNDNEMEVATKTVKERHLTVTMLSSVNKSRYEELTEELENDYTKGSNLYPKMVTEAYNHVIH